MGIFSDLVWLSLLTPESIPAGALAAPGGETWGETAIICRRSDCPYVLSAWGRSSEAFI